MAFRNGQSQRRDELIAIDLGNQTTKALRVRCRGERLYLSNYAILDAPSEKSLSAPVLAGHLKRVEQLLGNPRARGVTLSVGGACKQIVDEWHNAMRAEGLDSDRIVLVGPTQAFQVAEPEIFTKGVVALMDVGFKSSTLVILDSGEIMLHRVVRMGGHQLTAGLAEKMSISYAEAEQIKLGLPTEVAAYLQPLLDPLRDELRASIDFFENHHHKTVSQAFISGGSARSDFIIQALQAGVTVPCRSWHATNFLVMALPPEKMGELEQVAPQLTAAVGAGANWFAEHTPLAKAQREELRRKNSVKPALLAAGTVVASVAVWAATLQGEIRAAQGEINNLQAKWQSIEKSYQAALDTRRCDLETKEKLAALEILTTNRFLWGTVLDALQQTMSEVDAVQVVRFKGEQTFQFTEGTQPRTNGTPVILGAPETSTERIILTIDALDSSQPAGSQIDKYRESVASVTYFQSQLSKTNGVSLKSLSAPQLSPQDSNSFVMFTLQCVYPEKTR